ncbi:galactosyltransferase-related protein [Galbibacter sp. PAP.153]|uniref:galactosyltransferase-related protein n=1 Tax=Galbibacter sp. PAP.153 TaxID=3104623 RepID=UPI0030097C78
MINIIIPTKKKQCLKETLEHFSKYFPSEKGKIILVIDLDDDENIASLCNSLDIHYVGFYSEKFNKSLALNIGISKIVKLVHENDSLLICDADVTLSTKTISLFKKHSHIILDKVIETKDNSSRDAYGIIKCPLKDLLEVNGYDSNFRGWGFEDHDVIWRISQLGRTFIRLGIGKHKSHDDIERTRNYHSNNRLLMREENKRYFEKKKKNKTLIGTLIQDTQILKSSE